MSDAGHWDQSDPCWLCEKELGGDLPHEPNIDGNVRFVHLGCCIDHGLCPEEPF